MSAGLWLPPTTLASVDTNDLVPAPGPGEPDVNTPLIARYIQAVTRQGMPFLVSRVAWQTLRHA